MTSSGVAGTGVGVAVGVGARVGVAVAVGAGSGVAGAAGVVRGAQALNKSTRRMPECTSFLFTASQT